MPGAMPAAAATWAWPCCLGPTHQQPHTLTHCHPRSHLHPHPTPQVSVIAKFKPNLKRLLEFVILGQFVVQQVGSRGIG